MEKVSAGTRSASGVISPARARTCGGSTAAARMLSSILLLLLVILLAGFPGSAVAAPSCLADVDGANDPTGDGQGDITRLCTDNVNLPTSFDVYMSWDETGFSGANTGDACVLFDTDGDAGGNINYAICISVGGNPASLSAGPLIYSCGNSSPDRCASPTSITPSGLTTCSASVQNEDPFPAGDDYPADTVGVCSIHTSDIPSGAVRTNLCSFPSINPNSDPRDCVGVVGGGLITIVKDASPDDGTNFSFTLDGQTYTISGSGSQLVSVSSGQTYSITETVPSNWQLSTASCVDNNNGGSSVGTFNNVDTITGLAVDTNDDFTCTFTNVQNVDLVLVKSVTDSTPNEGDTITYTLQLTNNGPQTATAISVTDVVPAGLSYVASSIAGGDSRDDSDPAGSGLGWTVNSLASGSSTSLTFQVVVDSGTGGDTITNTATKTQNENDTDLTADSPSVDITVNVPVELVTTKVVDDSTPNIGQEVTFTITVENQGTIQATNVSLTDQLPAGITYSSANPAQGSYNSSTGVWNIGAINAGASVTLELSGTIDTAPGGTVLTNTTTAASGDQLDPDAVADDLDESVTVALTKVLTLVKSITGGDPYDAVGDVINYSFLVTNSGNVSLTGPVVVNDDQATDESCPAVSTVGNLDGELDPGEAVTCTATYTVDQADLNAGSVTNLADASADGTTSNTDTQTATATQSPALTLDKTTTATGYSAVGDTLDYSYLVTNSGNVSLAGPVTISDDKTTANCPAVSTVGNLDGNLDPGESVTCTAVDYVVTQPDIDNGSVTNVATASAGGTTSNQDSVTVFAQNLPASINGIVWLDENHDDVNQPGEPLLGNWIVEIYLGATLVDTVLTDAAGYYEITDLTPDSGYRILFRHPTTNIVWGEIDNLTLNAGNTVSDQSLPIDPQGVVYDSVARTTLSGAVLSLVDSAGTALPVACLLDPSQQNQTTAADGFYRFDVVAGAAPACPLGETVYRIAITEPAGYLPGPSLIIAPQGTPLDPTGGPDPLLVAPNNTAPTGADPTTYYLEFALAAGDPVVLNNHIPLDAIGSISGLVVLDKSASKREVSAGDMLFYTLTLENTGSSALSDITLSDLIPGGFSYVADSARLVRAGTDNIPGTDDDVTSAILPVGSRPLEFQGLDIAAGEVLQVRYLLRVGAGVVPGEYVNTATPLSGGTEIGNTASATVRVVADAIFDKTTIIGKVFHDRDGDGWQDAADATGLVLRAAIEPDLYIDGSLRVTAGGAARTIKGGGAQQLADGLQLGDLSGRNSVADLPERHRIELRAGLFSPDMPALEVSTREGSVIRIDSDGRQELAHGGDKARGMTGQDIAVQRRIVPAERGYELVVTITNFGVAESGIPGVRLGTVSGLLVETDAHGRYHIADIDPGGKARGRNFIVKVDPVTLPAGSTFSTENPRVLRITGGLMNRINFGVRLPDQLAAEKTAHIRLGEVFFEFDSDGIRPEYRQKLEQIAEAIRHYRCGVITITGHADARGTTEYNQALGERRASSVKRALGELLDSELLDKVEVRVLPAADEQAAVEPSAIPASRVLGALLDWLVSPAGAADAGSCVEGVCSEDAGFSIEVISRGELEPRSDNSSAAGRADNRRADVEFSGRLRLRDGGVVWATEDPAIIEPRLAVNGPRYVSAADDGRLREAAAFTIYTNYSAFIERWELAIHRASDSDLVVPLQVFSGGRPASVTSVAWDGALQAGTPIRPGDELVYRLRVYDAQGRSDETAVGIIQVGDRLLDDALSKQAAGTALVYGESNLARQGIPLAGSRVRIHGSDVPRDYGMTLAGEPVLVDENGRFAVENILPVGEHRLDVTVTDRRGERWTRPLGISVSGGYLYMVGLADITIGENEFEGNPDALPVDAPDPDGSFTDGRLAFYMKGRFKGKYLVTAQLDTTEEELGDIFRNLSSKDPRSVFRTLDPDRYYPTFGDDSVTTSDVDSQGRFYGRVEWDRSQALWGNFNTGITGNEFTQYDRSLYGGKVAWQDVDATRYGDPDAAATVFVSEATTGYAHNEFAGTGGSLYYLRNTFIVQGSEKVWVEVRERTTNRVLESVTLRQGSDYEVDDIQGRIILTRPLAQFAASLSPTLIKNEPLDGNAVVLLVDYEYLPDELDDGDMTVGVRAQDWLGDRVGIGGTYVQEDRGGQDYELKGVDATLRFGSGTYLLAEYASSEARQTTDGFFSDDGGLSFAALNSSALTDVSGDAVKLEARVNHAEVTSGRHSGQSAVWWKHRDAGFSVARVDDGVETTEYGMESGWQASERLSLGIRGGVIDQAGVAENRTLTAQADYRTGEAWTLSAAASYDSEQPSAGARRDATLVGAGASYEFAPGSNVYASAQATVDRDDDYEANDLGTLGMNARVSKRLSLNVEGSAGDRGEAIQLGADYASSDIQSFYTSYIYSTDRTDGRTGTAVIGQRRNLGNGLQVFTENRFVSSDRQGSIGTVYGLDYMASEQWSLSALVQSSVPDDALDGLERNAVSVASSYRDGRMDVSNKLEYRRDRGSGDSTQWLTANRLRLKTSPALTWLGRLNLSWTENHASGTDDGRFAELDLGYAWRPVSNDRLNLLGKYTWLYDLDSAGQLDAGTDERSHIVSLEGIYDINRRWEAGAKLAWKRGEIREDRDSGQWYRTVKQLAVLRGRYHLTRKWDGLAEYRWLHVDEADELRAGALLGIERHINDNLKVGVGYNFTDFSDDLGSLDYQREGWFINLVGKF